MENNESSGAIRLQKYFTDCGVLSRRGAETEIAAGRVTVNGLRAEIGMKIHPGTDTVVWNGKEIRPEAGAVRRTYIMLNKPIGYVTTMSDEKGRPTAADLLSGVGTRVYPIGRLDMYSDGLLLCTDDGDLANRMMHPSHNVEKKYVVTVAGTADAGDIARLTAPMTLDGYALRPVEARLLRVGTKTADGVVCSELSITLHEGRNRQIRRMSEQLGYTVVRLRRIRLGKLTLEGLPCGKWRYLEKEEIDYLKSIGKRGTSNADNQTDRR
jgi:23S rRNA pseudouridine2605 synthase